VINIARIALLLGGSIVSPPSVQHGMATYYSYRDFGRGPLYAHPSARYSPSNGIPWCAVNVDAYLSGAVQPGDELIVYFPDYDKLLYLEAWDAGPFDGYYVQDHPELPILVDIPQHLWPLGRERSARIDVVNVSAMARLN
jgi:hypothetical protein